MITRKFTATITVVVCALALAAVASVKNPVTKPHKVHATATWIVDLSDGSADFCQTGEATHAGRFTAEGSGTWNLLDFTIASASGTVTCANGEQVFIELPGSSYQVEFTGGTGHWSNVTGGFDTVWQSEPEITAGPVPGTIAITISYFTTRQNAERNRP